MQQDMHHDGTFCLARAAGLNYESAKTIAYASQFVDDNIAAHVDDHKDGSQIYAVPTAHHVADLNNREARDQRFIWVPFHFIPGASGTEFTEQLICTKNSTLARQMITNHASMGEKDYALELLGIGNHVYQDTFAHYGFSGVSSRRNRIKGNSLELTQSQAVVEAAMGRTFGEWIAKHGGLVKNIRSKVSDFSEMYSGALGHGGVSNYPDLPFLQWKFTYEQSGETVYHDNPATYFESAVLMYEIYSNFATQNPQYRGDTKVAWENIADTVKSILAVEGDQAERSAVWNTHSENGIFGNSEAIPEYDAAVWNDQCSNIAELENGSDGIELDVHRFYRAASYHVHYILRELLPEHGLMLV